MKDLGTLHFFLGIQVQHTSHGLFLSQSKYVTDLLDRAKMTRAKPTKTPLPASSQLSQHDHGDPINNVSEFQQLVGALQYCNLTRPDISFSVKQLCQFMHNPTTTQQRVIHYLKGSINHGLHFGKGFAQLNAYNDSDWVRSPDDRRSTTRYAIYFGPYLINWSTKKQPIVSKSSTGTEYHSLALCFVELF